MSARERTPRAWLAAVLSLLCTGLGHLYCGRLARAITLFLVSLLFVPAAVLVAFAAPSTPVLLLLVAASIAYPVLALIAVADSIRIARRLRDGLHTRAYQRPVVYVLLAVAGVLTPVGSTLLLRSHAIEAFRIASESMTPALERGDRVLVNKLERSLRAIERGEIVVFHPPGDSQRAFIKRVVGLPGDHIEVRDGRVLRNGDPLPDGAAEDADTPDFPEKAVPPDHFFLLGDNLGNSQDSREFGAVARSRIVGVAHYVLSGRRLAVIPR